MSWNSAGGERGVSQAIAVVLTMFLLFASITVSSGASAKKRDRSVVLEVPTTGKIMDVVYQPEFDEWWIKCREGDSICVYSYDARAREWGKVLFVPKKNDDKPKAPDKTSPTGEGEKDKGAALPDRIEETKPEHPKDALRGDRKTDVKWWDPFKLLKQGERLIRQPWTEGGK
jgi:hypothetical protein